jgi:hypothetical protein
MAAQTIPFSFAPEICARLDKISPTSKAKNAVECLLEVGDIVPAPAGLDPALIANCVLTRVQRTEDGSFVLKDGWFVTTQEIPFTVFVVDTYTDGVKTPTTAVVPRLTENGGLDYVCVAPVVKVYNALSTPFNEHAKGAASKRKIGEGAKRTSQGPARYESRFMRQAVQLDAQYKRVILPNLARKSVKKPVAPKKQSKKQKKQEEEEQKPEKIRSVEWKALRKALKKIPHFENSSRRVKKIASLFEKEKITLAMLERGQNLRQILNLTNLDEKDELAIRQWFMATDRLPIPRMSGGVVAAAPAPAPAPATPTATLVIDSTMIEPDTPYSPHFLEFLSTELRREQPQQQQQQQEQAPALAQPATTIAFNTGADGPAFEFTLDSLMDVLSFPTPDDGAPAAGPSGQQPPVTVSTPADVPVVAPAAEEVSQPVAVESSLPVALDFTATSPVVGLSFVADAASTAEPAPTTAAEATAEMQVEDDVESRFLPPVETTLGAPALEEMEIVVPTHDEEAAEEKPRKRQKKQAPASTRQLRERRAAPTQPAPPAMVPGKVPSTRRSPRLHQK